MLLQRTDANGFPQLIAASERPSALYVWGKRGLDIVLATLMLVLLAPLMLLIALLIRLDTPGPVLFRHTRVGTRRRVVQGTAVWEVNTFSLYKFRSMYQDVDDSLHRAYIKAFTRGHAEAAGPDGSQFKLTNDPRVTRVGRLLRKTSLDELPQLLNVVRGEMSLVGPRPVPIYEVAHYEPRHHQRLAALPGLTGLWQVKGRGRVSFEEMIALDVAYIRAQSLRLDLKILFATIPAVIRGSGAE